jgi:hypothetical protein
MTQLTPLPLGVVVQQIKTRAVPKSARTFTRVKVRVGGRAVKSGVASHRADFGGRAVVLTRV